MKKHLKGLLATACSFALVGAVALTGCSTSGSEQATTEEEPTATETVELQIFAANSLQKALPEVQALYTEQNPGVTFADTQFEASGTLVEKLAGGGSADLLICASKSSMDTAEENGSIETDTRVDMFNNDLVICTAEGTEIEITDLAELGTNDEITSIAIGDPDVVPAGKYALQALASAGLCTYDTEADKVDSTIVWDESIADKINMGAQKVGDVANYVSTGDAMVGFIYTSDIYRYDGVKSIYTTPADSHKTIVYPGAVCTSASNAEEAQKFMDFCLNDADAQEIFSNYGFELA